MLSEIGLEPDRVKMFNMSAAMAKTFVEKAVEMVSTVETLGTNPLRISRQMPESERMETEP